MPIIVYKSMRKMSLFHYNTSAYIQCCDCILLVFDQLHIELVSEVIFDQPVVRYCFWLLSKVRKSGSRRLQLFAYWFFDAITLKQNDLSKIHESKGLTKNQCCRYIYGCRSGYRMVTDRRTGRQKLATTITAVIFSNLQDVLLISDQSHSNQFQVGQFYRRCNCRPLISQ